MQFRRHSFDDQHSILPQFDKGLAIRKGTDRAFAQLQANRGGNSLGQRKVGSPGKNFHRNSMVRIAQNEEPVGGRVVSEIARAL